MSNLKKALPFLAAALLITVSTSPRAAQAAPPPRVWMPLQSVGPEWKDGMLQPLVDARIEETEYANGIKIDLNDFSNSVPNGNGRLYLSMADNAGFTGTKCLKPDGTGCEGGTLFVGLQVHASTIAIGSESGSVTLYLDAARQKSLDWQSCVDGNGYPNTLPAPEDRKIVIHYLSNAGQAALTLTVKEYKGSCQGWQEITLPGLDPQAWSFKASAREVPGGHGTPNFLQIEVSVNAQPRGWPIFTSQIVNERLFGLGVDHFVHAAAYSSFGHFPSIFTKRPTDLDTLSWATMDLAIPKRIDLAMTAYNVGQLQITDDGGQGEAVDFAALTYTNDVICMVEQMNGAERDEVVREINALREDDGLEPMTPVYAGHGDPPNNMILAAGPIIDADWVLYADLPEVSAECGEEFDGNPFGGGECIGDGAGYKGILWARIGVKKSKSVRGGKPETWNGDDFIDVFCTHTQADYVVDGEFANTQWCHDTVGTAAAGRYCVKSAFGPPDNPWRANLREEQWRALRNWSRAKRTGGNGKANGLDRPAFVLGDLNQIGPKGVSPDHPNEDVADWMTATSSQNGFGREYKAMREMLGTWPLSAFDQANGWAWDLYDLFARDEHGTWIGNGTESAIPGTSANDCITGSQVTGYDTIANLPNEARLDYILVLPAERSFPYYSLTGPSSQPGEPELAISANAGSWADGLGCASDHAQVSARIGLVQTGVKASYNPNKKHRVTYRVSHLWDFNEADGGNTDWMVQDQKFEMQLRDSSNAVLASKAKGYSDDSTPDGIAVFVNWFDSYDVTGLQKVRMGVWVTDHDGGPNDVYDGSSFGPGHLGPHFEFNHAYPGIIRFIGDFGTVGGTLLGTADPSSADPDGSCAHGCFGVETVGDGEGVAPDEDVKVTQNIVIEEIN